MERPDAVPVEQGDGAVDQERVEDGVAERPDCGTQGPVGDAGERVGPDDRVPEAEVEGVRLPQKLEPIPGFAQEFGPRRDRQRGPSRREADGEGRGAGRGRRLRVEVPERLLDRPRQCRVVPLHPEVEAADAAARGERGGRDAHGAGSGGGGRSVGLAAGRPWVPPPSSFQKPGRRKRSPSSGGWG